jgi:hypothetical protein
MREKNESTGDELLDRAVASLRDAPVPDGPSRPLMGETVSLLRGAQWQMRQEAHRPFRVLRIAAAVALAACGMAVAILATHRHHPTPQVSLTQPTVLPHHEMAIKPLPPDHEVAVAPPVHPSEPVHQATPSPSPDPRPLVQTVLLSDVSVVGQVFYDGPPPVRRPIYIQNCPECLHLQREQLYDDSLVINDNGTLRNVVVSISGGLPPGERFPVPDDPVVLDQRNCMYHPHVVAAMTGQAVAVKNSDPLLHTSHAMTADTPAFNFGQPTQGVRNLEPFRRVETFKVKCDIHPWMSAWVRVFDHPFFAVTGSNGMFRISGLAPGTYHLTAWHELYGAQEATVTVQAGEPARVDFTFGPK